MMCEGIESHFPFDSFRKGQRELVEALCSSFKSRGITIIEAPNGIGKTVAILTVLEYLSKVRGGEFLYLVRTHSQMDRVMNECTRFKGVRIAAMRGKGELCRNWRAARLKNYFLLNERCKKLREEGLCPYFPRSAAKMANKCLDPLEFHGGGCPYYEAIKTIRRGRYDVIVASYQYLLEEDLFSFLRRSYKRRRYMVVDEGHNLKRAWLSKYIKTIPLEDLLPIIPEDCWRFRNTVRFFRRSGSAFMKIPKRYIMVSLAECGIPASWEEGALLKELKNKIMGSDDIFLTEDELILLSHPKKPLEEILEEFESIVLISGTWGGEKSTKELLIEPRYRKIALDEWGDLRAFITVDFTTKFNNRNAYEYNRLATVIADLSSRIVGNMGIFTASYDVMEGLLYAGLLEMVEKPVFIEKRGMSEEERSSMVIRFKRLWREGAILLGVQGGRNSEGEDFPGPSMTTSVVVGLQLMRPGILREITLDLWREYSRLDDPDLINACRMGLQAAARPVRSPSDRGFLIFADGRFRSCIGMMPEWIRSKLRTVSLEDLSDMADEFFRSGS